MSEWTVDTLRKHVNRVFEERDRRYEQRFKDTSHAVDAALSGAKEAVLKAETASDKRFENVNEFRKSLDDQQRTYMPRAEAELRMKSIEDQIAALTRANVESGGKRSAYSSSWGYIVGAIMTLLAIISFVYRFGSNP